MAAYTLRAERLLARGGMGEVTLAERVWPNGETEHVVVKRIHEHLQDIDDFVLMFRAEGELARSLRHRNIVQVEGVTTWEGRPALVMEALDGIDVSALLQAHARVGGRLAPAEACAIASGVARGLAHAHDLRGDDGLPLSIVHRDIKPANVLVTAAGEVKVLDFGIAKSRAQLVATAQGLTRGTVGYMAPEQALALALDRRTDLFALGTLLWECLTCQRLWQRDDEPRTMRAIVEEPAPAPSRYGSPPGLDALVLALIAKLPASRPDDAHDVAVYLEACHGGREGSAPLLRALVERVRGWAA